MIEIFDNIRKLYRFADPCPELSGYIEFFSETALDATQRYINTEEFTVKLFPSYTPTIWINLGSPYHLKTGDKWHRINQQTDILLLRSDIVERVNLPSDNIFTIKFVPGGFEAIFGFSQAKISDSIIDVCQIITASFIKKVKSCASFEDRVALLQKFFLQKLEKAASAQQSGIDYVNRAIGNFSNSGMASGSDEVARQLYVTHKTLYRHFNNIIGTSAKNYFAIVRARTALTSYVNDAQSFSALDHGYYDNSHFGKDVLKFTGRKLSAYRSC